MPLCPYRTKVWRICLRVSSGEFHHVDISPRTLERSMSLVQNAALGGLGSPSRGREAKEWFVALHGWDDPKHPSLPFQIGVNPCAKARASVGRLFKSPPAGVRHSFQGGHNDRDDVGISEYSTRPHLLAATKSDNSLVSSHAWRNWSAGRNNPKGGKMKQRGPYQKRIDKIARKISPRHPHESPHF